ncbi:MAG: bleomycin resistance protein, partial [Burkholderiaceae bacterium]
MTEQIQKTIPVLASLDLSESVAFYTDQLGFKKVNQFDDYAIVIRDGSEIHFWACADRKIAEKTSCYVRVQNVELLYEELAGKGMSMKRPIVQPWGMKE